MPDQESSVTPPAADPETGPHSQSEIAARQAVILLRELAPDLAKLMAPLAGLFSLPDEQDCSFEATAKRIEVLGEILGGLNLGDVDARDLPLGEVLGKVRSLRPANAKEAEEVGRLLALGEYSDAGDALRLLRSGCPPLAGRRLSDLEAESAEAERAARFDRDGAA